MTKLTIITVCLNSAATIGAAIDSVVKQHAEGVEHLIIDGGSTDGTLDVVAGYVHLEVISEPDRGLYDAMNKGLMRARGEFVLFLNADDVLATGLLDAALPALTGELDCLCFGADFRRRVASGSHEVIETFLQVHRITLSPQNVVLGTPLLNAKMFRTAFLRDELGTFDVHYKIAADIELMWRAATASARVIELERIGYHYFEHDGSLTINADDTNGTKAAFECYSIACQLLEKAEMRSALKRILRAMRGGKFVYLWRADAHHHTAYTWRQVLGDVFFYGLYLVNRRIGLILQSARQGGPA